MRGEFGGVFWGSPCLTRDVGDDRLERFGRKLCRVTSRLTGSYLLSVTKAELTIIQTSFSY